MKTLKDLEPLVAALIDAWAQQELPEGKTVKFTLKIVQASGPGSDLIKDLLTEKNFAVAGYPKLFIRVQNCFINSIKDPEVPYDEYTVSRFLEEWDEHRLLEVPSFGRLCLTALNIILESNGYSSIKKEST